MPVIINDFQIVVEPPEGPARGNPGDVAPQAAPPPPQMKPEEITTVACVNRDRMERVRAD
ncbi:MAG: hypothetical protein LC795_15240 [Acidobacteria bacterium]|nr:hypothetical protein [Acidobacteriota bacterium]MCA1620631.1 hypothetical protein [Acidobacteriota bacterium]